MTATDARACPSSAIPSALAQLAHHAPLGDAEAGHLLDYLATIPDPRAASGQRHPLVAILALAAAAVTCDALQTHAEAAMFLVNVKQADYLFVVKANQPTLLERCARLAWHNVPELDRTRDRGHGRVEIRTLKAVSVRGFGFPHTAQVLHPQGPRPAHPLVAFHGRLRAHQPHVPAGQPRPPGRSPARQLGN